MEAFNYQFTALRGIQAGREFYVVMCPLKLIPKIFLFDEEEIPPELRAQRVLNRARVPEIAGMHHEYMNGTGYPRGASAGEIPIQARMMTVADIFDALTASDRPYKKAVPVDKALDILHLEAKAGKLDRDVLAVFVGARVFERLGLVLP